MNLARRGGSNRPTTVPQSNGVAVRCEVDYMAVKTSGKQDRRTRILNDTSWLGMRQSYGSVQLNNPTKEATV